MRKISNRTIWFAVLKYICFFICFYLLSNANIVGATGYFALAFFAVLIGAGQNAFILAPLFMLGTFLSGVNLISLCVYAISSLVFVVAYLAHSQLKKNYTKLGLNIYTVIASLPFWFIVNGSTFILNTAINVLLGILFLNIILNFVIAILNRKISLKLNSDEILSGMLFFLILSSGLSQTIFFGFPAGKIICYYLILLTGLALNSTTCLLVSTTVAFGFLLGGANADVFIPIILVALTTLTFKKSGKFFIALACTASFVASIYFFTNTANILLESIAFAVSIILFLLTTKKFVSELNNFFEGYKSNTPNLLNYTKVALKQKIDDTTQVVNLVSNILKKNVKQQISIEDGKNILSNELVTLICKKCSNYSLCHNLHNDTKPAFDSFFQSGLIRGKINLLDVPPFLSARCKNLPVIINEVNSMCQKFLKFNVLQNSANEGTLVATKQLDNVCDQLKSLSINVSKKTIFNAAFAEEAEKLLVYKNLLPTSVFCVEEDGHYIFTITFKESFIGEPKIIEDCISQVLKCSVRAIMQNDKTFSVVDTASCDVVFGIASQVKLGSAESGDAHSFLKMNNDNALFALCDGMGSGERACQISEDALSLVESFYKASFEKEQIYQCINKLLVISGGEQFCALDVCVINLFERSLSIYKLGSPESYIKGEEGTDIILSGALPIGIVDESEPKVEMKLLKTNDLVVLVSDGISDSFKNQQDLKEFIETNTTLNPQTLADNILAEANLRTKNAINDDATVLCFRVFEKSK